MQGAWFACVSAAARGQPAAGMAAVAAAVAVMLAWSHDRKSEVRLIALSLGVGFAWDSALARLGIVEYAASGPLQGWAPPWILALWVLFAPMLREPLRTLHTRPLVAALAGAAGGALSYAAAARLGACSFPDAAFALGCIAAGWANLLPMLLAVARRLDGGMNTTRLPGEVSA